MFRITWSQFKPIKIKNIELNKFKKNNWKMHKMNIGVIKETKNRFYKVSNKFGDKGNGNEGLRKSDEISGLYEVIVLHCPPPPVSRWGTGPKYVFRILLS